MLKELVSQATVVVLLDHPLAGSLSDIDYAAVKQLAKDNPDMQLLSKPFRRPDLWNAFMAEDFPNSHKESCSSPMEDEEEHNGGRMWG